MLAARTRAAVAPSPRPRHRAFGAQILHGGGANVRFHDPKAKEGSTIGLWWLAAGWRRSRSRRVPNQWPVRPERMAAGVIFWLPTFFHRSTLLTTKCNARSKRAGNQL